MAGMHLGDRPPGSQSVPSKEVAACTMGTGSAWLREHQNTFVSGPFLRTGVIVVSLPIWGPDPSTLPFTPHYHPGEAGVSREATLQVMKLCRTLDLAIWLLAIFSAQRFLLQYFALFSFFLLIHGTPCPVQVMPKAGRCLLLLLLPSPTSPAPPEQQQQPSKSSTSSHNQWQILRVKRNVLGSASPFHLGKRSIWQRGGGKHALFYKSSPQQERHSQNLIH